MVCALIAKSIISNIIVLRIKTVLNFNNILIVRQ
jgi:hypothetical protein